MSFGCRTGMLFQLDGKPFSFRNGPFLKICPADNLLNLPYSVGWRELGSERAPPVSKPVHRIEASPQELLSLRGDDLCRIQ